MYSTNKIYGICINLHENIINMCRCFPTYAITITMKSSQFIGSLRKVNFPIQKPLDNIFNTASNVYIAVKTYLLKSQKINNVT